MSVDNRQASEAFYLAFFFSLLFSLFVAWYTPLHFEENIITGVVLYPISGEQFLKF